MSDVAPIVVGVLLDHPGPESPMIGEMRRVVDQAVSAGRLDRDVSFVTEVTDGLPQGTAAAVTHPAPVTVREPGLVPVTGSGSSGGSPSPSPTTSSTATHHPPCPELTPPQEPGRPPSCARSSSKPPQP